MIGKVDSTAAAELLAALGHPTRIALVKSLSTAETFAGLTIAELTAGSGLSRQAITKHLKALAEVGLVRRQKPGRETWFELQTAPINMAIEALVAIAKQRAHSKQRLKTAREKLLGKDI